LPAFVLPLTAEIWAHESADPLGAHIRPKSEMN